MAQSNPKSLARLLQYIPIAIALGVGRLIPFRTRGQVFAALGRGAMAILPSARKRIEANLDLIYPKMPKGEKSQLVRAIGANTARTLGELLMNDDFRTRGDLFSTTGDGLAVLEQAKAEGRGAIIVSAHFGQWEAIRHALKARDMETGAVYAQNNNGFYEDRFLWAIKQGGEPIYARSAHGNMAMVRHLKKGGFFALLVDQSYPAGPKLNFMGIRAATAIGAYEMALRFNLPLVPAFATRDHADPARISIEFEAPITGDDPNAMAEAMNARIEARIRATPEQWYWMHNRWKHREQGGDNGP